MGTGLNAHIVFFVSFSFSNLIFFFFILFFCFFFPHKETPLLGIYLPLGNPINMKKMREYGMFTKFSSNISDIECHSNMQRALADGN